MALTVKDVAQRSGVSTATVSRVLNSDPRISAVTTERVRRAIDDLGYSPNHFARGLKTSRSHTIGFLAPEFVNEFFMGIAQGVENRLRDDSYSLVIGSSGESLDQEKDRLETLVNQGVDGLIAIPAGPSGAHFQAAVERGVPVVLVDRTVNEFSTDAVLIDNINGTYGALEVLLLKGHHRIGFLGGNQTLTSARERYDGYRRALDDYRVALDPSLVRFGDFHSESGAQLMRELMELPDPPPWVFVSNYFMHLGATRYLMENRSRLNLVPSIVSFDEMELSFSLGFCRMIIRQPIRDIGTRAAEFLLSRVSGGFTGAPRLARLKTELIFNAID
jgi:LacI family transcriptional regulator